MTFIELTDDADECILAIRISEIMAIKKVEAQSMILGEDATEFTLIRCRDNVTYQVKETYAHVREVMASA